MALGGSKTSKAENTGPRAKTIVACVPSAVVAAACAAVLVCVAVTLALAVACVPSAACAAVFVCAAVFAWGAVALLPFKLTLKLFFLLECSSH